MTRKEINKQLSMQYPSYDLIPDDDYDYKDGIEDGWEEGALWMQKKCIEKAWNWIKAKVDLSYTDYDNYLKTMEG